MAKVERCNKCKKYFHYEEDHYCEDEIMTNEPTTEQMVATMRRSRSAILDAVTGETLYSKDVADRLEQLQKENDIYTQAIQNGEHDVQLKLETEIEDLETTIEQQQKENDQLMAFAKGVMSEMQFKELLKDGAAMAKSYKQAIVDLEKKHKFFLDLSNKVGVDLSQENIDLTAQRDKVREKTKEALEDCGHQDNCTIHQHTISGYICNCGYDKVWEYLTDIEALAELKEIEAE